MELARDKFLMGCYTGQRVSDYNGITSEILLILWIGSVLESNNVRPRTL